MDTLSDDHNYIACWSSKMMKEADTAVQECTAAVNTAQRAEQAKSKIKSNLLLLKYNF